MSALEQAWAARASRLLTDVDHIQDTRHHGGSPDSPELDGPDLRWPGYLGADFRPGDGILGIANIHRGFRSGRLSSDPVGGVVTQLVEATRMLQRAGVGASDSEFKDYIDGHRHCYERGLGGGWDVGRNFKSVVQGLGGQLNSDGARGLAYVNASCCQYPELNKTPQAAKTKTHLKRLCMARHPLGDVLELLGPRLVLVSSSAVYDELHRTGYTEKYLVVGFHQFRGDVPTLRPLRLDGRLLPAWTPARVWLPMLEREVSGGRR